MRTPVIALLVLAFTLAGCTGDDGQGDPETTTGTTTTGTTTAPTSTSTTTTGTSGTTHDVTIEGFAFDPPTLTIQVGDTVRWTNQDSAAHTATSDDNGATFDTGSLAQGESGSWTATEEGVFPYHCSFHPSMNGSITVEA